MEQTHILELLATLFVAIGGTIGGAMIALRKALKGTEANGGSRADTEARIAMIERVSKIEAAIAVLAERVRQLENEN